jgi:hypothetical protein
MISAFRRDVTEICKKFKKKAFFLDFLSLEKGTDKLSRSVGTELPLNAA